MLNIITRKTSNWIQRHVNDPYVKNSVKEGYRSRSAYKLLQIIEKEKLLNNVNQAIDLGSRPGGWTQVLARKGVKVIAVDILDMLPVPGSTFLKLDMRQEASARTIIDHAKGKSQLILSDMCPNRSGDLPSDALEIIELNNMVLQLASDLLEAKGKIVLKMLMCEEEKELFVRIR